MLKTVSRSLFACGLLGGLLHVYADDTTADDKTKEVLREFIKGVKAKDLGQLMKSVEVPWLDEDRKVIRDMEVLKKVWKRKLDKLDSSKLSTELLRAVPYSRIRDSIKDASRRKLMDQVLDKDDGVVMIASKETRTMRIALVRVRGGKPKIVGGPHKLTDVVINNEIPEVAKTILEKAKQLELFSLDPERQQKNRKDGYYGWNVLGKVAIKDMETRKKLVAAFVRGVKESDGTAAYCFNPRHGIRVTHEGKKVDFVICFECLQVQVIVGGEQEVGLLITDTPQIVFDKVLRDSGIPLAKKPDQ
jgi:hypothetical protein